MYKVAAAAVVVEVVVVVAAIIVVAVVVVIGTHLSWTTRIKICPQALIEGFRTCIWVPLPDGWEEYRDPKTGKPYFFKRRTGQKTWSRDFYVVPMVRATPLVSTEQPKELQPRKATFA